MIVLFKIAGGVAKKLFQQRNGLIWVGVQQPVNGHQLQLFVGFRFGAYRLASLLAPGGVLVIFTPAFEFLWGHQDEVSQHFRRYTAGELRAKIEGAGLHVEKLTYANTFLMPLVWAGRLLHRRRGRSAPAGMTENSMHPKWSNGLLQLIFAAEQPLLRVLNLPFGVSLLTLASKPS